MGMGKNKGKGKGEVEGGEAKRMEGRRRTRDVNRLMFFRQQRQRQNNCTREVYR